MATRTPAQTAEQSEMHQTTTRVQEHHDRPVQGSAGIFPNAFPSAILHSLWISVLAGGVLGLVFGRLLVTNVIVIDNWEQMYSVGSFTLTALWTVFGIALGIIFGGIGSMLIMSPDRTVPADGGERQEHADDAPDETQSRDHQNTTGHAKDDDRTQP